MILAQSRSEGGVIAKVFWRLSSLNRLVFKRPQAAKRNYEGLTVRLNPRGHPIPCMEQRKKVLLIDSASEYGKSISGQLPEGCEVRRAEAPEDAVQVARGETPDLIILDVTLPHALDLSAIDHLREQGITSPVLVLSPAGEVKAAVEAIKRGATDVVEASASPTQVLEMVSRMLDAGTALLGDPAPSRRQAREIEADFGPMAGRSPVMIELFKRVDQLAGHETTVLITGESGTGKELIAREIHKRSSRKHRPFVALNCAAIPETLIESELFGHEKGAFTHAVERRLGQFELADGGTLFLDEIGELSLAVQVKLLRFLQEQEFYRVGRSKPISVDVRVVTATNRNLEDLVRIKQFRQDLLYRINVINLHIPPLRDRQSDIPCLLAHAQRKLKALYRGRQLRFAPEALDILLKYPWPGNIRELENMVEGLLALAPSDEISAAALPEKIRLSAAANDGETVAVVNASGLGFDEAERLFETNMILRALKKANFVQTRAAELLGISRRILKYKMDKLGIDERGEVRADEMKRSN